MTPDEFRVALVRCGWSAEWLAAQLGVSPSIVKSWRAGTRTLPTDVAAWVQRAVRWLDQHPPPRRTA